MATMSRAEPFSVPAHQAFQVLHVVFTITPIVAGIDKFLHLLVNWEMYLAAVFIDTIPLPPHLVMQAVGVVEILAGILVAVRPRIGGWVVAFWLWAIILNLLLVPGFYDIALRDFGLSLGAVALARLSLDCERKRA
jgi:hypothetical protein